MNGTVRGRGRGRPVDVFIARLPALAALVLLTAAVVAGGSSQPHAPAQLIIRLAAVAVIGALIAFGDYRAPARARVPALLVGGAVTLVLLHLIPLPFGLWSAFPGRAFAVTADALAGAQQPWRPLSLAPDRTLNALVALLPVVAGLLVGVTIPAAGLRRGLVALAIVAGLSAVVSMLQLGGVGGDRLYYYDLASMGEATGLFPNRNHNAVLLVCGVVAAAHLTAAPRHALAQLVTIVFLAVAILLVQSRSGTIIALFALVLSYRALARLVRHAAGGGKETGKARPRWQGYAVGSTVAVLVGLGVLAAARLGSFARFATASESDARFSSLGTVFDLVWHYFPMGSGFGTFDPVFRIAEPLGALHPEYLNHAHNDLLETAITAGLPGLALVAAFLFWLLPTAWRAWRADGEFWAVTLVVLALLAQSLVDYPLRTPLLGIVFVTALVCMCRLPRELYPDGRGD